VNNLEPEVLNQVHQGNQEAFTQLVEAYQRPVYNLCYRMLGDPAGVSEH
jgi:RNA polymerase sigma-70 factor (ECF subfamily)